MFVMLMLTAGLAFAQTKPIVEYDTKISSKFSGRANQAAMQTLSQKLKLQSGPIPEAVLSGTVEAAVYTDLSSGGVFLAADLNGDGNAESFWLLADGFNGPLQVKGYGKGGSAGIAVTSFGHELAFIENLQNPLHPDVTRTVGILSVIGLLPESRESVITTGTEADFFTPYLIQKNGKKISFNGATPIQTGGLIISLATDPTTGDLFAVYLYDGLYRVPKTKAGYDFDSRTLVFGDFYSTAVAVDEDGYVFLTVASFTPEGFPDAGFIFVLKDAGGGSTAIKTGLVDAQLTVPFGPVNGITATHCTVLVNSNNQTVLRYKLVHDGPNLFINPAGVFLQGTGFQYLGGVAQVSF